jgi:hypothetical protein
MCVGQEDIVADLDGAWNDEELAEIKIVISISN